MSSGNRFLIIGCVRSGTTMIQRALRAHPNVSMYYDEIDPRLFFGSGLSVFGRGKVEKLPLSESVKLPEILFDSMSLIQDKEEKIIAHGLKCAFRKVETAEDFVINIRKKFPHIKIIFLIREDNLRQYLSFLRAETYGFWHSSDQGQPPLALQLKPQRSDAIQFIYEIKKINETLACLQQSHDCLILQYESQILENLPSTMEDICNFLKIKTFDFSPFIIPKLNTIDPKSIQRFEFVSKLFEKTKALDAQQVKSLFSGYFRNQERKQKIKHWMKCKIKWLRTKLNV